MKKLDDIPKKNVFEAPEGYFERLPGVIQARVAERGQSAAWIPFLRMIPRLAVPALMIAIAAFFYLNRSEPLSTEDLIASVDSASLAAYLDESDLSTEDLLESLPLDRNEADAIQEQTIDDIDLNEDDI
ncbi:MAG TPA: hypothetical protein VG737_05075, partial [Cyclobacteriaceae bacterium]|nr:hypothetical protein [Cyclobacteriaceae bacterium]